MGNMTRARLCALGKKNVDLLDEIRKRGFPNLYETQLSRYIGHRDNGPQAMAVRELIQDILKEWEEQNKPA